MSTNGYLFGKPESVKDMRLKVSPNGRYLTDQNGKPFFYLADTAWALFKRPNHEELEIYYQDRLQKGFNTIQAYILRGLKTPNAYGQIPLVDNDPSKPNEAYFQNIDYAIKKANEMGLVMALVVTWGEHVLGGNFGKFNEQIFTRENSYTFAKFLGNRYKDYCVIWYLGGDTDPLGRVEIWEAMVQGLRDGGADQLISFHGPGSKVKPSSSYWFHDKEWLDFNVLQTGHRWTVNNYDFITHDYNLKPVKPTIDIEPTYENHPDFDSKTFKRADAHQVRESMYWEVLSGAAGHAYGCVDVRMFFDLDVSPKLGDITFRLNCENTYWVEALDGEGARNVGYSRKLFETYPWYKMVPDQSVIAGGQGTGEDRKQAAIAEDGSFMIVYLTLGNTVSIHMDRISGTSVNARWFNPRDGRFSEIGLITNEGIRDFTAPTSFDKDDWVLVFEAI